MARQSTKWNALPLYLEKGDTIMKKKALAVGLSIGMAASVLSPVSSLAAPKNVFSSFKVSQEKGTPEFVSGRLTKASGHKAEAVVLGYLNQQKSAYKLGSQKAEDSFTVASKQKDKLGSTVLRLQQVYQGVPVWGSTQAAVVDKEGVLKAVSGSVAPNLEQKSGLKNTKRFLQRKPLLRL